MTIVGEAYRELQQIVKTYTANDLPVLFSGETGTGKELFLKLYFDSNKKTGEKMVINCAAYSDDLLRSEVFGHVQGAFTGAVKSRPGKIASCDKGILAFDEIGDASPEFQAAILRVSDRCSYSQVGSDEEKNPDTLIIAATNKIDNLRQDLKKRFHILPIPPLQKDDIPALAEHFLGRKLTAEVIRKLKARDYPGNIRELKRACERLKVERDEKIFTSREVSEKPYNFDYRRYKRELNTWNRYIQPLIDHYKSKYNLPKYEYQLWDGDPLEFIYNNDEHLNPGAVIRLSAKEYGLLTDAWGLYDIGKCLQEQTGKGRNLPDVSPLKTVINDSHKIIKKFQRSLKDCFEKSNLPCFLGYIHLKAEAPSNVPAATPEQPHLLYLLALSEKEAREKFTKHYYDYNNKKYPDGKEFKAKTGITKKSLRDKVSRHQKVILPSKSSK